MCIRAETGRHGCHSAMHLAHEAELHSLQKEAGHLARQSCIKEGHWGNSVVCCCWDATWCRLLHIGGERHFMHIAMPAHIAQDLRQAVGQSLLHFKLVAVRAS